MLLLVGLIIDDLGHTSMVIQLSDQSEQWLLRKITIKAHFRKIKNFDDFLVIDVDVACNMHLERLVKHKKEAISSIYHKRMKYPLWGCQRTIATTNDPFQGFETYYSDVHFYRE